MGLSFDVGLAVSYGTQLLNITEMAMLCGVIPCCLGHLGVVPFLCGE